MKKMMCLILSLLLVLNLFDENICAMEKEKDELEIFSYTLGERNNYFVGDAEPTSASAVAIFIAGVFVGYLYSVVQDGIIISATGKSGGEWVAYAINQIVGKPYKSTYYLPKSSGGTKPFSALVAL